MRQRKIAFRLQGLGFWLDAKGPGEIANNYGVRWERRRGALLPLCRTFLAVQPLPVLAEPTAAPILWLCPCC